MNSLLKRLTNRNTGYVWADLSDGRLFVPSIASEAQATIRELLGLNRLDTDFFVMGLLHTLRAHLELGAMLPDDAVSYDVRRYTPPSASVIGAELLPDHNGPPEILHIPTEWPPPTRMELKRLTDTESMFIAGGQSALVSARLTAGKLRVDWPAFSGVSGLLSLQQSWEDVNIVTFVSDPAAFPHDALLEALRQADATLDILEETGLTSAWTDTRHAAEAVAIVTTALILSNPIQYS